MSDVSSVDEHFMKAVEHHQADRLVEAQRLYQHILELDPSHSHANHNLGILAIQLKQPEMGLPFLLSAWELSPDVEQHWISLGECLIAVGRFGDAIDVLHEALNNGVNSREVNNLILQAESGMPQVMSVDSLPAESVPITKHEPTEKELEMLSNYYEVGNYTAAVEYAREFTRCWPSQPFGWSALVGSLAALGDLPKAEVVCRQAIGAIPNSASLYSDLGGVLCELGRYTESEKSCQSALSLQPDHLEALNNLGNAYKEIGAFDEAEEALLKAIELNPNFAVAHNNLGDTYYRCGRLIEAECELRRAVELNPKYVAAHHNLGLVLMDLGRPKEADESYQRALCFKPDHVKTIHNRLFYFNYRSDMDVEEVFEWYKRYGEDAAQKVLGSVVAHNEWSWDGERRLRIGYLSPDFRGHACRFFMEPFLREHDKQHFEIFAYSNMPFEDQYTACLRKHCDHWRDIFQHQDISAVEQIVADKIDILVDLAGHSKGNRLLVFAHKPAPIQVTYLGYDNTTGLTEIDYFLGDEQLIPLGSEHLFTETVWRLPHMLCYEPPKERVPEVGPLPALRNGYITFGSMLRVVRLNDDVIRIWSSILKRVPNSKLRLYQEPFKYSDMQQYFVDRFAHFGIDPSRIIPSYITPHWSGYSELDIALDGFPNNGGVTTLEALWMGVPVLTQQGRPCAGCYGAAILHPLGLYDWIAKTEEEYIEQAVAAAGDQVGLSELRAGLRERFRGSPNQDSIGFTRSLESAYTQMVNRYRSSQLLPG